MAEVVFDGVTKVFDDGTVAVSDLNLSVEDGALLVLVGPSGCGKTTSLRMVAGLEQISAGAIRIGERVVNQIAPKDRDIAMVFQNYALYPHMTVFENMAFGLRLRKMRRPEVKSRVEDTAKFLELYGLLTRKPGQLSGGQRQRVAMGRAIVRQPKVFLMDEPLSNLDAKLRVQMRSEISRLQRDVAVTTLYVTHDQVEAMTMGDTVAVLRLGVLQQVASPQTLYRRPANLFVTGFIGSPAMDLVEGVLGQDNGNVTISFGGQTLTVDPALVDERPALRAFIDRRVIVGIRPEEMEDAALHPDAPADRRLKTTVDLREDMGSELLIHFGIDAPPVITDDTRELAVERGEVEDPGTLDNLGGNCSFVAGFDADSTAKEGDRIEVLVDTRALHFFDRETRNAIWDDA